MYKVQVADLHRHSFSVYHLQLLGLVCKEVGIRLGDELPLIGLLHKVLVSLLVGEVDGVLLAVELNSVAIHEVGG